MLQHPIDDTLTLHLLEPGHAPELHAVVTANAGHLGQFLPWAARPYTQDDAKGFIEGNLQRFGRKDAGFGFGVREHGRLVGMLGIHDVQPVSRVCEVGYWLAADATGRGIMTRATEALVGLLFSTYRMQRVIIRMEPENHASRGVPERLGFTLEGTLRQAVDRAGQRRDHLQYAMLASEWRGPRNPARFGLDVTPGVRLTLPQPGDETALLAVVEGERERLQRTHVWPKRMRTERDAAEWVGHATTVASRGRGLTLLIRQHDRISGGLSVTSADPEHAVGDLTGWLAEAATGRGLMTHATHRLAGRLFDDGRYARLTMQMEPGNTPAMRLAERTGFQFEGTQRQATDRGGKRRDLHLYGRLATDPNPKLAPLKETP